MEVLHPHCAGLDIHKDSVVACVRHMAESKVTAEVRAFRTSTQELMDLADWLSAEGVTHVGMEATGVYWRPIWHILADGEFELVLANAAHVKNVPGRKTDVKDAVWLSDLMAHGLIRGSFVPDTPTQQMRDLLRTRKQFVRERSSHVQRIQKALEDANIKLDSVVSDVVGLSARRMIEALIRGESDPQTLAALADRRLHAMRAIAVSRASKWSRCSCSRKRWWAVTRPRSAASRSEGEAISQSSRVADHHTWCQSPFRRGYRLRGRPRYGSLRNRWPVDQLGRALPQKRRECRQTTLHADEEGCALAEEHPDPMRLVSDTH